jgi:hypothetical protein
MAGPSRINDDVHTLLSICTLPHSHSACNYEELLLYQFPHEIVKMRVIGTIISQRFPAQHLFDAIQLNSTNNDVRMSVFLQAGDRNY